MLNDLLIDKRILERNIKKGRLDAAEYRKMLDALPELKGKHLSCWCSLDKPCHADILCELANKPLTTP